MATELDLESVLAVALDSPGLGRYRSFPKLSEDQKDAVHEEFFRILDYKKVFTEE